MVEFFLLPRNAYQKSPDVELINGSIMAAATRVILAAYYRPPNRTDSDYRIYSADEISSFRTSAKKSIVILGGDFNIPDIDWKQMTTSGSQYLTKVNKIFLDITADNNFEQLVDFPTQRDKTLEPSQLQAEIGANTIKRKQ